jgi:hypothetical protein
MARFDAVVFLGDKTVRNIYTAFNILIRENLALGGLKQWEMNDKDLASCRCENQFTKKQCMIFSLETSIGTRDKDEGSGHSSPYSCDGKSDIYVHYCNREIANIAYCVISRRGDTQF